MRVLLPLLFASIAVLFASPKFSSVQPISPPSAPNLAGKFVVVTGGTAGVGLEAARTFAAGGATVFLTGRSQKRAGSIAATLPGGLAEGMEVDFTDIESVRSFEKELKEKLDGKRLDFLLLNAGMLYVSALVLRVLSFCSWLFFWGNDGTYLTYLSSSFLALTSVLPLSLSVTPSCSPSFPYFPFPSFSLSSSLSSSSSSSLPSSFPVFDFYAQGPDYSGPFTTTFPGGAVETMFAANHLGHFSLLTSLLPKITKSGTRVVFVSSIAHHLATEASLYPMNTVNSSGGVKGVARSYSVKKMISTYGATKAMNAVTANKLNRIFKEGAATKASAVVVTPGMAATSIGSGDRTPGKFNPVDYVRGRKGGRKLRVF